jgi:hypothetical protein
MMMLVLPCHHRCHCLLLPSLSLLLSQGAPASSSRQRPQPPKPEWQQMEFPEGWMPRPLIKVR